MADALSGLKFLRVLPYIDTRNDLPPEDQHVFAVVVCCPNGSQTFRTILTKVLAEDRPPKALGYRPHVC